MARNLLLIDDDKDFHDLVKRCLPDRRVRCALTVADGARLLREEAPDVVLLDLGLPDAQGLEALDQIVPLAQRQAIPVPVIVVTGDDVLRWGNEIANRGASGLLLKRGQGPEWREELLAAILLPPGHLAYLRRQGALASLEGTARIGELKDLIDQRLSPEATDGLKALPQILKVLTERLPPPATPPAPGAASAAAVSPAAPTGFFADLRAAWREAPTARRWVAGGVVTVMGFLGWQMQRWFGWLGFGSGS